MGLGEQAAREFAAFLDALPRGRATRIHIFCDSDCDGLPAGALLSRSLALARYGQVSIESKRKGESAWLPEVIARLAAREPEALFVLDVGSRAEALLPGVPTMLIDHHLPGGVPAGAELVTGYGTEPTPTTGLLVYWCVRGLVTPEEHASLLWLAALSILSDVGDKAPFAELAEARKRWKLATMREAVTLVNAPRRSASADAGPALELLLVADGPRQVVSGDLAQTAGLRAARQQVSEALLVAKRAAPKFSRKYREQLGADLVALRMDTPCQVHPLVAQTWRGAVQEQHCDGGELWFSARVCVFFCPGTQGRERDPVLAGAYASGCGPGVWERA